MNFVFFVLIAAALLWSLFGLGGLCCRTIGYRAGTWPETIGIGMAGLIVVGGVLNLCRISYGPVYDCMLVAGMIAAFWAVPRKIYDTAFPAWIWYQAALSALIIGTLWMIGHAELPPSAFNYQDDFEKYFVHPVRMLRTGTVFGSPLSAIGAETLGGQAVLQGVAVHHFAIPYLFAMDGLFALLLCLLIASAAIPRCPGRFLPALMGVATVCVVNPMVINVSATYTTCALVMTALLVCRSLYLREAECRRQSTLPLLLGMVFAGLVALKTINAVYLLTVFAVAAVVQLSGRGRGGIKPGGGMRLFATGGATMLFVMPWLLVHVPNYLAIAAATINGGRFAATEGPYPEPLALLSFDKLFYGSSYAHYTVVTVVVVLYCVGFYVLSRRRAADCRSTWGWLFACGAAVPLSSALILAFGPQLNGYFANIRYTTPVLIAGVGMLLPIALNEAWQNDGRKAMLWSVGMVACGVCVVALFSEGFVSRVRQASRFGNSLAFSGLATDKKYLEYNRSVLAGKGEEHMRRIQETIPQGASVLAWVTTPYHLNFSRNLIYDVEQAGVGNPWASLPKADYVMYQYAGYAVPHVEVIYEDLRHPGRRERHVARNALAVIDAIENLWNGSPELYNDGEVVVFKVDVKDVRN